MRRSLCRSPTAKKPDQAHRSTARTVRNEAFSLPERSVSLARSPRLATFWSPESWSCCQLSFRHVADCAEEFASGVSVERAQSADAKASVLGHQHSAPTAVYTNISDHAQFARVFAIGDCDSDDEAGFVRLQRDDLALAEFAGEVCGRNRKTPARESRTLAAPCE